MANSWVHAQASARHFKAGKPEDYHDIHLWIDQFKSQQGDVRHRSFLHNTNGPFMAEQVFGPARDILGWDGQMKSILVRDICETHIMEDLGWIPSPSDWLSCMECKVWMGGKRNKFLGREDLLEASVPVPNPSRTQDA